MDEQKSQVTGNKRKLVTIRQITDLRPIEGADAIEVATVEGWKLVTKKGEFQIGDPCLYFEIDSFLPDGNPAWQFLVDKSSRVYNGVKGHKLRTIKLRGQISQGLALRVDGFPEVLAVQANETATVGEVIQMGGVANLRDLDFSDVLNVEKLEAPLSPELAGQAEGLFPSFIQKTDQERCQNLVGRIFDYEDKTTLLHITPEQASPDGVTSGRLKIVDGQVFAIHKAQADPDDVYEMTIKLDGSSMTAFGRFVPNEEQKIYEDGVCSRNLQLKVNEENKDNTFVSMFINKIQGALRKYCETTGRSIALQGELMGPGIQNNREQLKDFAFYLFDVYDIDNGRYEPPFLRSDVFNKLVEFGAQIAHVPMIDSCAKLSDYNLNSVDDLLAFAEGPSIKHPVREGVVFKRMDGQFSFKAISNKFLEKEKD